MGISRITSSSGAMNVGYLSMATPSQAQLIQAPSRPSVTGKKTVFLAGTTTRTDGPEWRDTLFHSIAHLPITVFNPLRPDWDSSWKEDIDFAPFREQVEWEFDRLNQADLVVVYFGPQTDAPISLLEFGLFARSGKLIVCCHKDYRKRGNIEIVSQKLGLTVLDAVDGDLVDEVTRKLQEMLQI
ncbi:hypothetical protein QC761_404720 [Podospora bellae-mahoneyi]|uniref:Nucleoside 2-deoxyribosyltransferase n=1 Tax=Podospora bellae-mahoneyi TaxID=2093777 RepID=A0ABR0FIP7_9PEZI|nr:hypothetical protein QC761_404720 [Podospora bellae-mahoneyi]